MVGLKPTYGRVSQRGIYPNAVSLDHPGPIARSARDAGLLLQGMAGFDAQDPTTEDVPVPDFTAGIEAGVSGLRLALCPDLHYGELDSAVATAMEAAVKTLAGLGARIETVAFPLREELQRARKAISQAEFLALHRERLAATPEGYGADVRERLAEAAVTTLDDYVRACRDRERARRADGRAPRRGGRADPARRALRGAADRHRRLADQWQGRDLQRGGRAHARPAQRAGCARGGGAHGLEPQRAAAVAPDRGPALGRGQGAAHRPCLRGGDPRAPQPPPAAPG